MEDDPRSVRQTTRLLARALGDIELTVASNRSEAVELIDNETFDLLICDLKIPAAPHRLGTSDEHGRAVYAHARRVHPGLPVIFLSAKASTRNTGRETSGGSVDSALGVERLPLTQLAHKGTNDLSELLEVISIGLGNLDTCPVADASSLDPMLIRAVQMYGVLHASDGAKVRLTDGLSGSRVGIVTYSVPNRPDASVLLKVDRAERIEQERHRYDQYVANRLPAGAFAAQLEVFESGLRDSRALISNLASPTSEPLFTRLARDFDIDVIPELKEAFAPWSPIVERRLQTVGDLRRSSISDELLESLPEYSPELRVGDDIEIEVTYKISHGDLHGENILVATDGRPLLIDFADTEVLPSSYDPVALELSMLAHPKAPPTGSWPNESLLRSWTDLTSVLSGCPYEPLERSVREWGLSESDELQWLAVTLSQCCWLMKHGGPAALRMRVIGETVAQAILGSQS